MGGGEVMWCVCVCVLCVCCVCVVCTDSYKVYVLPSAMSFFRTSCPTYHLGMPQRIIQVKRDDPRHGACGLILLAVCVSHRTSL